MTDTTPDRFGETIDAVIDSPTFRRNIDPVRARVLMDAETDLIDCEATAIIERETEREARRHATTD